MACRDKFPVAADPKGNVARAYDVLVGLGSFVFAGRTSYVITPDGNESSGNDIVDGGSGDDKIVSVAGYDTLVGGPGPDRHLAPEIEAVVGLVADGVLLRAAGLPLD